MTAVATSRLVVNRDAHRIALVISILYFLVLVRLIAAVVLDPDGAITGGTSTLLTLPWSIFTVRYVTGTNATVALHVIAGAVNAAILYVLVRRFVRRSSLQKSIITVLAGATIIAYVVWTLNGQFRDARIRIVNDRRSTGAWMALDESGLKALSETPGIDSEAPEELRSHLVLLPNQTRGNFKGRRFLMKDGTLVVPFPTRAKDKAEWTEVEKIKIINGPNKGLEGWIVAAHLKRLLTMFAM